MTKTTKHPSETGVCKCCERQLVQVGCECGAEDYVAPVTTKPVHARMAKTAAQVAALDTLSIVLRYRQLCASTERAMKMRDQAQYSAGYESDEVVALCKTLDETANLRDLFKAEAEKRAAI